MSFYAPGVTQPQQQQIVVQSPIVSTPQNIQTARLTSSRQQASVYQQPAIRQAHSPAPQQPAQQQQQLQQLQQLHQQLQQQQQTASIMLVPQPSLIPQNTQVMPPSARPSMTFLTPTPDPFGSQYSDAFDPNNVQTYRTFQKDPVSNATVNNDNTIIGQWATENGEVENVVWYCPKSHEELHNNYNYLCDTVSGRVLRLFLLFVPGVVLGWNAFHLDDCTYNHMIPIWGVTSSSLWIVYTMLYFLFKNNEERKALGCKFLIGVLVYSCVTWFVMGSVWIFDGMNKVDLTKTTHVHYCEMGVYISCLAILLIGYFIIAIWLFFALFTFQYNYQPSAEIM